MPTTVTDVAEGGAGEASTRKSGLPMAITSPRREVNPHGGWQAKLRCLLRHGHGEFSKPWQRRAVFAMPGTGRIVSILHWGLRLDVRDRRG
jgi:hypothetical protein